MVHGPKCIGLNLRAFGSDGSCDGLDVHVVRFNPHFVVPFKTVWAITFGFPTVVAFAFGFPTVVAFAFGFKTVFAFAFGFTTAFAFTFGFGTVFAFAFVVGFAAALVFCFFAGGGSVAGVCCGEPARRYFLTCSSRSA